VENPAFRPSHSTPASLPAILVVLQTANQAQAIASLSPSDFSETGSNGRIEIMFPELSVYSQHTLLVTSPLIIRFVSYQSVLRLVL
jgi:hypothetical protein